jgi:hypothetical protein
LWQVGRWWVMGHAAGQKKKKKNIQKRCRVVPPSFSYSPSSFNFRPYV